MFYVLFTCHFPPSLSGEGTGRGGGGIDIECLKLQAKIKTLEDRVEELMKGLRSAERV
jgi:hypothetical protein